MVCMSSKEGISHDPFSDKEQGGYSSNKWLYRLVGHQQGNREESRYKAGRIDFWMRHIQSYFLRADDQRA